MVTICSFQEKAKNVKSLTDDPRRTTSRRTKLITIGYLSNYCDLKIK